MAKLTKFPVTAPDGTEYRVTIRERDDGMWVSNYADVRLYVKRKRFGYRCIYVKTYRDGGGVYYVSTPNYIRMASEVVKDYREFLVRRERERIVSERMAQERASELRRFAEWDGRIAE